MADLNSTFSDKPNTDFTSEIGPFWLEIVGYLISVLNRLGQKRNLSQWDFKNIWILVVTDKE